MSIFRTIVWALTAWLIWSLVIGPIDETFSISNGLLFLLFWAISAAFWTGLAVIMLSFNSWVQGGIQRSNLVASLQTNTRRNTKR